VSISAVVRNKALAVGAARWLARRCGREMLTTADYASRYHERLSPGVQ